MSAARFLVALLFLTALPFAASAQEHGGHHAPAAATSPVEPGQGAFAAIAEIVALLDSDPETDWSRVNIPALREHLLDMDLVVLDTSVKAGRSDKTVRFEVTGDGRTLEAIRAMVPAHARELNTSTEWGAVVDITDAGVTLNLSSDSEYELAKIGALGFYGVMATGAHHQEHHLALARGDGAH